jgi:hypothetical protein
VDRRHGRPQTFEEVGVVEADEVEVPAAKGDRQGNAECLSRLDTADRVVTELLVDEVRSEVDEGGIVTEGAQGPPPCSLPTQSHRGHDDPWPSHGTGHRTRHPGRDDRDPCEA